MSGEKRRYMRFNVFMDAIGRSKGLLKKLKVNNFSREGLGLISRDEFKAGDDIEIEVMIPGDNVPVILEGEVAWASDPILDNLQYKSGVRLKKVTNSDRSRFLEYIYKKWIMPGETKKSETSN